MKRVYCLKLQFTEPVVVVMCLRMHLGVVHYFQPLRKSTKGTLGGRGLNHTYVYKMMNNHCVYTVHSINIYTVCFVKEGGG